MTIVELKTHESQFVSTSQDRVRNALRDVLEDPKFVTSPMMALFLRYVVEQTLNGSADRIKAYTVAVEALGKPTDFDPQRDPSVRVMAKRLRSSLDDYYGRTSNHDVIIRLQCGSYVPSFESANPAKTGTH